MTTNHNGETNRSVEGVSRRQFLRITGATMALTTLGSITDWNVRAVRAADPQPGFKRLVIINLRGGNDGANTVVPIDAGTFPTYTGGALRPTIGIGAGTALSLNSGPQASTLYGLHPNLTNLQTQYTNGNLAIIHNVGYPNANLSHFSSEDIWSFAVRGGFQNLGVPQFSGWISRFADVETLVGGVGPAAEPMGVVSVGQGNLKDFRGGQVASPLQLSSAAGFQFADEPGSAFDDNHIYRLQVISQTLDNHVTEGSLRDDVVVAMKQAHDLSAQVQTTLTEYNNDIGTAYPNTGLGRRLRDVAALMYGGFNTKIFYTGMGGFDTHSGQAARHDSLMQELNDALGPFISDLQSVAMQNIWADTQIIIISEFGRRNFENGSQGTDHGHALPVFVLGGAVAGGMYGDMQDADFNTGNGYMPYRRDFRTIYQRTLTNHLGVAGTVGDTGTNLGQIFPEAIPGGTPFADIPPF